MTLTVATVVGARPQFVKAGVVSRALRRAGAQEVLIHTGQHFDPDMSGTFFTDLQLPEPAFNLGINSLGHGAMTGRMMEALEGILEAQRPDLLLVYGDTNSTLAGALVAAKLHIPIAHVEAGLRSFNRAMPEEVNRVLTDQVSRWLFAPTELAVECLAREGITSGVHLVGDVMMDAVLHFGDEAARRTSVLSDHGLLDGGYHLATMHRPANTDDPERLKAILGALCALDRRVVLPLHPRTRARVEACGLGSWLANPALTVLPPAGYLEMLMLERHAAAVITDSGGVQKEAYICRRPCFTLRSETEWQETVDSGWNQLVEPDQLIRAMSGFVPPPDWPPLYGDGRACDRIVDVLVQ